MRSFLLHTLTLFILLFSMGDGTISTQRDEIGLEGGEVDGGMKASESMSTFAVSVLPAAIADALTSDLWTGKPSQKISSLLSATFS
jgi:hypothetical protein